MFGDLVKQGQNFQYSVNIVPTALAGVNNQPSWLDWILNPAASAFTNTWYPTDWNGVAQRIASAASGFASARVMSAGADNITLSVTATMDRDDPEDIRANLDQIVSQQPEISSIRGSRINRTSTALNPQNPGGKPFEMTPAMWALLGISLFLLLKD